MKLNRYPAVAGLITSALVLLAMLLMYRIELRHDLEQQRAEVLTRLSTVRARLEGALNSRLFLTRSVAAYVATYPNITVSEFQSLGRELVKEDPVIGTVSLSKNCVIGHIYPVKGHEAALGLNLLEHPERRDIVRMIMKTRRGYVAGPVELVEGGSAFIGYTPVYRANGRGENGFWGLTDIVIRRDALFAEAGFFEPSSGLLFALRGKDGLGPQGPVFWGDEKVFSENQVSLDVTLPNGSWLLAAVPTGGWQEHPDDLWLIFILGGLLAVAAGGYVFVITNRPLRVQAVIEERKKAAAALRESEERFRMLTEKSLVGVYLFQDRVLLYVNQAFAGMLGYRAEDVMGKMKLEDLIAEEDRPLVEENVRKRLSGEITSISYELRFKKKDGSLLCAEAYGSRIEYQGRPAIIGTLLDITDRKTAEAARLLEQEVTHLRTEKQMMEAQLRILQAQIEPHFLFNTLANIISLIERDPVNAKRMLRRLTDFLRISLLRTREETSTLAQETEMLINYLEIFRLRMGPRLVYVIDIPEDLLSLRIPPMLLQPLVENAIIHGLEPSVEGGSITITARRDAGLLRLSVVDRGAGLSRGPSSERVGLANVRNRLLALFGNRARLLVEENEPCGVAATLEIPSEEGAG